VAGQALAGTGGVGRGLLEVLAPDGVGREVLVALHLNGGIAFGQGDIVPNSLHVSENSACPVLYSEWPWPGSSPTMPTGRANSWPSRPTSGGPWATRPADRPHRLHSGPPIGGQGRDRRAGVGGGPGSGGGSGRAPAG